MMRKFELYVGLTFFTFVLVSLIITEPMQVLMAFVGSCFMLITVGAIASACISIKNVWDDFQYRRRMQHLLGDMTLEEILE